MELNLQPLDYKKIQIFFGACFLFAPLMGFLIRNQHWAQKGTFLVMCYLSTSGFFHAQEWGLTIHSELYRGHARGFHYYWAEVAAVVLIWAHMLGDWKRFKFFPPGFWLYILYCFAGLISLINAPLPLFGLYAAFKAFKIVVIFVAAYNFVKNEADLRFALVSLSLVVFWQLIVVLNQKYVLRIYQVWGTFEHQNSLSMFMILIGMVFLAVAMGPKRPSSNYFLLAFIACAAIVQSTLSRAGLAIFAVGTMLVVAASLIDRPTRRRLGVLAGLACVGIAGLSMTADTIIARFQDYGNEESRRTRDMLNLSSRMMLQDQPLGIGWNNFATVINPPYYYSEHIDQWNRENGNFVDPDYKKGIVESLWWLHLAETGYQGFLAFVAFIGVFLWWNLRNAIYFWRRYYGAVSVGIFFGCSMNYLQSFLERVLTQPRNMILWLILLAITARINVWRKQEQRLRRRLIRERIEQVPYQRRLTYKKPPEESGESEPLRREEKQPVEA